jgi:hypothetical protein
VVRKTLNKRGKGNRIAQRKRRKERLKNRPPKQEEKVLLIDGNYSFYPDAFCKYHGAYLTQGLIDTHRCLHRQCPRFRKVVEDEEAENQSS